jgi:hypothetical protein
MTSSNSAGSGGAQAPQPSWHAEHGSRRVHAPAGSRGAGVAGLRDSTQVFPMAILRSLATLIHVRMPFREEETKSCYFLSFFINYTAMSPIC